MWSAKLIENYKEDNKSIQAKLNECNDARAADIKENGKFTQEQLKRLIDDKLKDGAENIIQPKLDSLSKR